jgi:hypothetical protein
MNVLNRIKLKISRGEYEFSQHSVLDKLPKYNFTTADVLNTVFSCENVVTQTDDIRGTRYVIFGYAIDDTPVEVVCRFANNKVFFITIYCYE